MQSIEISNKNYTGDQIVLDDTKNNRDLFSINANRFNLLENRLVKPLNRTISIIKQKEKELKTDPEININNNNNNNIKSPIFNNETTTTTNIWKDYFKKPNIYETNTTWNENIIQFADDYIKLSKNDFN